MTTAEFPKKPDDDALLRLAMAVLAEGTDMSVSASQRNLAGRYGPQAGFHCTTERATAGLGAFISDLLNLAGPRDVASMLVAFQGWYGPSPEQAQLSEYGCDSSAQQWLEDRMASLSRVLWDGGTDSGDANGQPPCHAAATPPRSASA